MADLQDYHKFTCTAPKSGSGGGGGGGGLPEIIMLIWLLLRDLGK